MEHVVVERVLTQARHQLGEPLTVDDLARMARFSKYHFARMFRRVTGISPRRFLYALRLQEAKRLLVTTSLSVADISNQVGYHSVGTFTTRFAASVGVPPAVYRRQRGDVWSLVASEATDSAPAGCAVTGVIDIHDTNRWRVPVFVGLFAGPLAEGRPARSVVLGQPGAWAIEHVPEGSWYVLAVSVTRPVQGTPGPSSGWPSSTMLSTCGPLSVGREQPAVHVNVRLRPMRMVDPPIVAPLAGVAAEGHPPSGSAPEPVALARACPPG